METLCILTDGCIGYRYVILASVRESPSHRRSMCARLNEIIDGILLKQLYL